MVHYNLQMYTCVSSSMCMYTRWLILCRQAAGAPPTVHTAASIFNAFCYENKDGLSAGIIVGGWDKEVGPSVYNIPLGGGLFRQPWAIGGEHFTFSSLCLRNLSFCRFRINLRLWLL